MQTFAFTPHQDQSEQRAAFLFLEVGYAPLDN
jgi:hypothetical protein